jgi:hypothetical protein
VNPGALHHFAIGAIGSQTYATAFPLTVTARDANSNTVTSFAGTVDLSTTAGSISPTISSAFASGVCTQSVMVFQVGAGKTITATRTAGSETGTSAAFTVNQAPLTVTANHTNRVYGAANPAFTASYSGFVNGDTASVISGAPELSTAADPNSAPGSYAITASLGTLSATNYSFGTFSNGTLTISQASSTNALATSSNPAPTGSNVTFTATLTAVAPGAGTPTGTVQFRADGSPLGPPVTLAGGVATLTTNSLSHGSHAITAEYGGDTNFLGSTNSLDPSQVINTRPVASDDALLRGLNCGVKVRVATLLANDTDADSDSLTLSSVDSASVEGGTVTTAAPWVIYTPPAGFTNADSFSCVITDGSLLATNTVSITRQQSELPSVNSAAVEELGNGSYRIQFFGIPGRSYTVQFTESLEPPSWQTLGTESAGASGQFEFTDTPGVGAPARIYRSIQQ